MYHLRGTPAQFVGIVYDQPDERAASKKAIEEYKVPENLCGRLMAQRRSSMTRPIENRAGLNRSGVAHVSCLDGSQG
jgi:hypothetical protein